ncbi:hypothetical protein [Geopsychrobacter electrodiphilus]|uniref:hypothetical protein n=1 Tax=Geopsychrobacter electrodiphilus TaxID=225196 RepID=UPI000374EEFC|nr:hypothetical protein [Geopsychrobacter electrodiphilus]
MPRFTEHNQGQGAFVTVHFDRQLVPGTFEHTLNYLVDQKLDLSIFHENRVPGTPHLIDK